jgi:hypothetical protein
VQPAPTAEDFAVLQEKLRQLEDRLSYTGTSSDVSVGHLSPPSAPISHAGHTPQLLGREPLWQHGMGSFPPAAFLDSRMFQWGGLQIPKPSADIPPVSPVPFIYFSHGLMDTLRELAGFQLGLCVPVLRSLLCDW